MLVFAFLVCGFLLLAQSAIINFEDIGGKAHDQSIETVTRNRDLLNATWNAMGKGDIFVLPNKTFHVVGGIIVDNLSNVVFQIEGTLRFTDDRESWPADSNGHVLG